MRKAYLHAQSLKDYWPPTPKEFNEWYLTGEYNAPLILNGPKVCVDRDRAFAHVAPYPTNWHDSFLLVAGPNPNVGKYPNPFRKDHLLCIDFRRLAAHDYLYSERVDFVDAPVWGWPGSYREAVKLSKARFCFLRMTAIKLVSEKLPYGRIEIVLSEFAKQKPDQTFDTRSTFLIPTDLMRPYLEKGKPVSTVQSVELPAPQYVPYP